MSDYVPKPDPEGINSSEDSNPLKDVAILLTGFLAIVTTFYFISIGVSDWALTKVTLDQEMKWFGSVWKPETSADSRPADFEALMSRVNQHIPFPLRVDVMCTDEVNAFAFPGGRIFLTKGLLEKMQSENGLVFVLGHEAGHVVHRDNIRGLGRQIILGLGAALFGFGGAETLVTISETIGFKYDRDQESRADEYGLELTKKIYGHTWGSEELFKILSEDENLLERSLARLASTHPPSLDRIKKINASQVGSPQSLKKPERPFQEWAEDFGCSKK